MSADSPHDTPPLSVSVVLCTYNRADLLPGCLESLAAQTADKGAFEIIVVDNNCTDATPEMAASFARREPNVRVVGEAAQGLSHARNRGWREARGVYVAYIDDDARAEPDWVQGALAVIDAARPDIFGGPIYPFYLTGKPDWFKDEYEIRMTAPDARALADGEYISGANFFARRDLLRDFDGFDATLGMKGRRRAYGEETDLMIRVREATPEAVIWYDPTVRVRHLVPTAKMRIPFFFRRHFAHGQRRARIFGGGHEAGGKGLGSARRSLRALRQVLSMARRAAVGLPFRDRKRFPYAANFLVEEIAPQCVALGMLLPEKGE